MLQIGKSLRYMEAKDKTKEYDVLLVLFYEDSRKSYINKIFSRIVQKYNDINFLGIPLKDMYKINYDNETHWSSHYLSDADEIIYLGNAKCNLWRNISCYK